MTDNRRAFGRRAFMGAAVAAGLAVSLPHTAGARPIGARAQRVPLTHEEHRVVVIGSGFGGGVSALRLAQAGVPVVVLERGVRWPAGPNSTTFPSASAPDKRVLWHKSNPELFGRPVAFEPYTGLLEAVAGDNMTALCATGVGGGSLIYQGMSLQPTEELFARWFPGGFDWAQMDGIYYPRVAKMLGLATAPDELIESPTYEAARIFAKRVTEQGLPLQKIPMPIDWDYALAELRGEMTPSYTNGDGALGVDNGGKNSVDVTYLAQAESTGRVDVRTCHEVTSIERAADGRWVVRVDRTDTTGTVLENLVLTAGTLIMAAGSVNTTRLLVRAGALGAIPDLPDGLGDGWGTNADRIYLWTDPTCDFGIEQGGPVVYGSLNWSDPEHAHTVIQASIPSLSMDLHSTVLVGYGVSDGRGTIRYDAGRDQGVLSWPHDGDGGIQWGHIDPTVRAIAGPTAVVTDTNAVMPSTWHPLGGANMGVVCDIDGRVLGQRGLYVLDGALMPGNTAACNPSMTIAAVAERALDNLVRRDVGSII